MQKVTFESAVERAKAVHGDRYQYKELVREGVYVKLRMVCATHGEFLQTISNHLKGKGCVECGGKKAHTLEKVRELARTKHGDKYEYLALTRGAKPTLTLKCPEHGEFTQDMYNHLQGKGCRKCFEDRIKHDAAQLVTQKFGGRYRFVSEAGYNKHGMRAVKLACDKHGAWETTVFSISRGHGCDQCARDAKGESFSWKWDEFISAAKSVHGDKYVYTELFVKSEGYTSSRSMVRAICKTHGEFVQTVSGHVSGSGCPICSESKAARSFVDFLHTLTHVKEEARLCPPSLQRWDAYLPDYNLAFEFNGNYWHSDKFRTSTAHRNKYNAAMERGIRTVTIYEDEWAEKRSIVENLVYSLLGKQRTAIHARKLKVVTPTAQQARAFFEAYHIQGMPSASRYLALSDGENIEAMLAYAMRSTGRGQVTSDTQAEITRYATKSRVNGGFTKLLAALKKDQPRLQKLTTFSDIRLFDGSMYARCGFKNTERLPPDYFYIKGGRRYHKANAQKDRLAYPDHEKSYTELELAEFNGLHRVYDCGKLRWELTLKG